VGVGETRRFNFFELGWQVEHNRLDVAAGEGSLAKKSNCARNSQRFDLKGMEARWWDCHQFCTFTQFQTFKLRLHEAKFAKSTEPAR
jgi:hypothetical protein